MRAFGPRISAYAFWTTTDIHTDIYISREISIEHPSVGLASLAQLCACVCRGPKSLGGITRAKRAHAQSQYWAVKSDQKNLTGDTRIIHFDFVYASLEPGYEANASLEQL